MMNHRIVYYLSLILFMTCFYGSIMLKNVINNKISYYDNANIDLRMQRKLTQNKMTKETITKTIKELEKEMTVDFWYQNSEILVSLINTYSFCIILLTFICIINIDCNINNNKCIECLSNNDPIMYKSDCGHYYHTKCLNEQINSYGLLAFCSCGSTIINYEQSNDDYCSICQNTIGTEMIKLKCKHTFHIICFNFWIRRKLHNTRCPNCNHNIYSRR